MPGPQVYRRPFGNKTTSGGSVDLDWLLWSKGGSDISGHDELRVSASSAELC